MGRGRRQHLLPVVNLPSVEAVMAVFGHGIFSLGWFQVFQAYGLYFVRVVQLKKISDSG